jgi:glycosyltransferase involved in cell wall biosynthesis
VNCHLAYSVPFFGRSLAARGERKVRRLLQECGFGVKVVSSRQPSPADLDAWPVCSPYENTKHLYRAISQRCPTILYHLTERVRCDLGPEDVFLGHPCFPHKKNGRGVTELAVRSKARPRRLALITPLHCDTEIESDHINRDFLNDVERLLSGADVLFAIMGEYWWDRWDTSPFRHWKNKMVRLDMAVDVSRYPRVKRRFNPPGKRGFLYIGPNSKRKGSDFLARLMGSMGQYPRGWVGHGADIPNIARISGRRPLDPQFMAEVARSYDFFVSPSRADPNPTTILESMAWGFPVVSTVESGYYETSYRKNIYIEDFERSLAVLRALQHQDEGELIAMSDAARAEVERDYTWERFTGTIVKDLGL